MPLIVVYNLPYWELENEERIDEIEAAITQAILEIPELELTMADISFSFPQDPTVDSESIPVTIIVELLFEKPKRTNAVRQQLASAITAAFNKLPGNEKRTVEVAVKRFDPEKDGFAMIKK